MRDMPMNPRPSIIASAVVTLFALVGNIPDVEAQTPSQIFQFMNSNGDNFVSRSEFMAKINDPKREEWFSHLDADRDGRLTRTEIELMKVSGNQTKPERLKSTKNGIARPIESSESSTDEVVVHVDATNDARVLPKSVMGITIDPPRGHDPDGTPRHFTVGAGQGHNVRWVDSLKSQSLCAGWGGDVW